MLEIQTTIIVLSHHLTEERINVGAYGNTADAQITSTPITNDISLDVNENESKTIDFSSFTSNSNINTVYSIESSTNSIVSTLSEVSGTTVVLFT